MAQKGELLIDLIREYLDLSQVEGGDLQLHARPDVRLVTTVDPGGEDADWKGEVGFVPTILDKMAPKAENTIAIVCGPPVMIKYTFPVLEKFGFADDMVYTTLENRMKCGFGKCGRCNVGKVFVCKDGPVFTLSQLKELPAEY